MNLSVVQRTLSLPAIARSRLQIGSQRFLSQCAEPFHSSSSPPPSATNNNRSTAPPSVGWTDRVFQEIARYAVDTPIEQSHTPPSTWYTHADFFSAEQDAIFGQQWVAVDVAPSPQAGSFKTGTFLGEPYLLTRNSHDGHLQAFYNVCPHAGSCVAGPWTTLLQTQPQNDSQTNTSNNNANQTKFRLKSDLINQPTEGCLSPNHQFCCPYHGWRFNVDGRLTKATNVKGIQQFKAKDYSLKPIPVQQVGPIVFLRFGGADAGDSSQSMKYSWFDQSRQLLFDRLEKNGFVKDLSDLKLIKTKQFTIKCNWKVFCDNYGDGCYHCSYAHVDLASNIDENNYSTEILSPDLSIQQAPPSFCSTSATITTTNNRSLSDNSACGDQRFGTKTAVYAQWYPNIMLNRYGPWFDVDIVIPIDATTSRILKAWFLEADFELPSSSYIDTSLASSQQVHDEDVFCAKMFKWDCKAEDLIWVDMFHPNKLQPFIFISDWRGICGGLYNNNNKRNVPGWNNSMMESTVR